MASTPISTLFFILSLLLTTATATTNTTTTNTTTTTTNTTTTPHTTHKQAQLNTIIDAIIGASDFTSWSKILSAAEINTIPLSATVFIPIVSASTSIVENSNSPVLLPYHIIRRRFSFLELQLFPTGTRLPTLLPGTTLCITNNSAVNFTVNGDKLTQPDLFQNDIVYVHGVDGLLRLSNLTLSPPIPPLSVGFKGSDASSSSRPRRIPPRVTGRNSPRVTGRRPPRVMGRRPRYVWVSGGVSGSCSWGHVIVGLVLPCILKGIFGITIDGV